MKALCQSEAGLLKFLDQRRMARGFRMLTRLSSRCSDLVNRSVVNLVHDLAQGFVERLIGL
ncbi:hypothetical protein DmGdi_10820 [Gluconobacter sp. Gdi]|nr:hypothetical protein DmGdi_10820 [Gluconobacter sp. Gdi]